MTDVLEPVYVYARDPRSRRVVTICYTIADNVALVGVSMNHPDDCFVKRLGRKIARGRMELNQVVIDLHYKRARERYCEILDRLAGERADIGQVEPLIAQVIARAKTEEIMENRVRTMRKDDLGLPPTPETAFRPDAFKMGYKHKSVDFDLLQPAIYAVKDARDTFFLYSLFEKLDNWLHGGKR